METTNGVGFTTTDPKDLIKQIGELKMNKQYKVEWTSKGSVVVSIPEDKIEEFKELSSNGYINQPLVSSDENYPSDFEKSLNDLGGEILAPNHTWGGEIVDSYEHN